MSSSKQPDSKPLWLRITHWINVIAVVIMVMSGWRIYNASPIFDFKFPDPITMGGWLGGAIQWHFAAMWLLVINGALYLLSGLATGRLRRQMLPVRLSQLRRDLKAALAGKLEHDRSGSYNAIQKAAYLFIIVDLIVIVLSGLVVFKPVQFETLRVLMGGFDTARIVHFVGMAGLVGFVIVHVVMALLVPRTVVSMVVGRNPT